MQAAILCGHSVQAVLHHGWAAGDTSVAVPNLQSQMGKIPFEFLEMCYLFCGARREINETKQVQHFALDAKPKHFQFCPTAECASTFYGRLRANLAACLMFVLPAASKTQLRQQRERKWLETRGAADESALTRREKQRTHRVHHLQIRAAASKCNLPAWTLARSIFARSFAPLEVPCLTAKAAPVLLGRWNSREQAHANMFSPFEYILVQKLQQ